jgi:hypothetical protein
MFNKAKCPMRAAPSQTRITQSRRRPQRDQDDELLRFFAGFIDVASASLETNLPAGQIMRVARGKTACPRVAAE